MRASYLPQLDGLRAVAILGVLAFHLRAFELGWSGVLLFFVLSGYLITGILVSKRDEPHYFRNFYARRALRIFPAYYITLIATLWALDSLALKSVADPLADVAREWPYFAFYAQNYWMGINRFATPLSPELGFTWTLAVEEQFYLIWPIVVYLATRRALTALCVVLVVTGPALRWGLFELSGNAYLALGSLSSNLDGLALGALIALIRRDSDLARFSGRGAGTALLVGAGLPLALIVATTGLAHYRHVTEWLPVAGNMLFPTLAALFFAGLIMVALVPGTLVAKVLSLPPLVALGRISYGVYLYHTLVIYLVTKFFWVEVFLPIPGNEPHPVVPVLLDAARIGATIGVAALSWRYLERPLLRIKSRFA